MQWETWLLRDRPYPAAIVAVGLQRLDLACYVAVLGCFGALGFLWRWQKLRPWQGLLVDGLPQAMLSNGILMPRFHDAMQAPVEEAALLAEDSDLPTVAHRTSMPGFHLHLDAPAKNRPPQASELVVLRIDKAEQLAEERPGLEMEERYYRGAVAMIRLKSSDEPE